jgi:hypothetical protein
VEGRSLSPYDVLVNCIGVACAVWVTAQLLQRGVGMRAILVSVGILVFVSVLGGLAYRVTMHSRGLS